MEAILRPDCLSKEIRESTTFYYSNFKLFPDDSELLFASYLSFKKNIQDFLGDDWSEYAQKAISQNVNGSKTYLPSKYVFDVSLEVWLELRKEINELEKQANENRLKKQMMELEESKLDPLEKEIAKQTCQTIEDERSTESKSDYVSSLVKAESIDFIGDDPKGFDFFHEKVKERCSTYEIDESFFRAVVHGFYISAFKIWGKTLESYSVSTGRSGFNIFEESKRFFLNKLQSLYNTKFKVLKPIFVATEKCRDYIYNPRTSRTPSFHEGEKKNVDNFSSSMIFENSPPQLHIPMPTYQPINPLRLDSEKELKSSFKNLNISDDNSLLGKRTMDQALSTVEIKKVNKKFERLLDQHLVELAAHYVNTVTKTPTGNWQISKNFVTNMVEVNYNKFLQMENRLQSRMDELKNEIKIRFIQPAREFYNCLMEVWIILKTKSLYREVLFQEYLEKVKGSFGSIWNEKFVNATHSFFMTLFYEWNHLKQIEINTEEKVFLFIKKVKESMLKVWEETVLKKAEELSQKKIQ